MDISTVDTFAFTHGLTTRTVSNHSSSHYTCNLPPLK